MNSLAAFMMNTVGSASAQTATDDTVAYGLLGTLDNTRYYFTNLLHQNPTSKDIVIHTFTDGVAHLTDTTKKISYRISVDRGLNFGTKATLYDPTDTTFQVQDPGIGFDTNGRLHILADCHEGFTIGDTHEVRYMYSDDNGATVSSPVTIAIPGGGLATFRMYGKMIQVDDVLLAPAYFFTEEGDFTNSARYVLRSTDFGANWAWVLVETTTAYINESELLAINDDVVIMVSREEAAPKQFIMYKSEDKGVTWFRCGALGTGVIMSIAAPCRLHKFLLDDGTAVAAMYFTDKTNFRIYGLYGRLENFVVAGVGGWNLNTLTILRTDGSVFLHYGDMIHYNGNMNAYAVWTREASATPLVDNELIHFTNPTTHYGTLFLNLTPVTIYDALGSLQMVFDWRGLQANNSNDYGIVTVGGEVTRWKSIPPAITGTTYNYSATAGGITLGDGVIFDGTKRLSGTSTTPVAFMSNSSAGYTDLNYTIHMMIKPGTSSNPDAAYGIFGTSGASAGNIGVCFFYDDRVSQSRNNAFRLFISKGSAGFNFEFTNDNILTANTYQLLTVEVDLSQVTTNNRGKIWVNGVLQTTTVTTSISTINNPPTYVPQIGGCGNDALPFTGGMKYLIFQNVIDIASVRTNIIDTLMDLEGL